MLKKYLMPLILAANLLTSQEEILANTPLPDRTTDRKIEPVPVKEPLLKRDLSFNLGTIYTFENDDKMFSSIHQLAGKGNDYLGLDLGGDRHFLGRLGLVMTSLYLSSGLQYYEHELSHEFGEDNKEFEIDFTKWTSPYSSGVYPQYISSEDQSPFDIEKYLRSAITGLNQDEYTGYTSWKQGVSNGSINFDEGIFFLTHKLFSLQYAIMTETRFSPKEFEDQGKNHRTRYDDSDAYIRLMEVNGLGLSKKEYLGQIIAADLFSWHVWNSVYSVFAYLVDSERTTQTSTIEAGAVKFTPPLISLYLTPQGSFYDLTSFVHYRGKNLGISIGTDLDFSGGGSLDTVRIGGEFQSVNFDHLAINPFCYLDLERTSFHYAGISSGLELLLEVTSSTFLRGKFEYNARDIIENTVKREGEGLNFILGIDLEI